MDSGLGAFHLSRSQQRVSHGNIRHEHRRKVQIHANLSGESTRDWVTLTWEALDGPTVTGYQAVEEGFEWEANGGTAPRL